jgi:hypothetical protein
VRRAAVVDYLYRLGRVLFAGEGIISSSYLPASHTKVAGDLSRSFLPIAQDDDPLAIKYGFGLPKYFPWVRDLAWPARIDSDRSPFSISAYHA